MSLVPSLLQAIVHVDGEALVMHAGDKPYVVSPTGQVDLASRGLALDAVNGIVNQLLPPELQHALDEFGAVQYELPAVSEFPGEHFTIVAARGDNDVWVEIRRRRIPEEDHVPDEFFAPPEVVAASQPYPVYASAASPKLGAPAEPPPDALDVQSLAVAEMLGAPRVSEPRSAEADLIPRLTELPKLPDTVTHVDEVGPEATAVYVSETEVPQELSGVPTFEVPTIDVPNIEVPTLDVPTLDVPPVDAAAPAPLPAGTHAIETPVLAAPPPFAEVEIELPTREEPPVVPTVVAAVPPPTPIATPPVAAAEPVAIVPTPAPAPAAEPVAVAPVAAPEPIAAPELAVAREPIVAPEPVRVPEPVAIAEPVFTAPEPVAPARPVAVPAPAPVPEPVAAKPERYVAPVVIPAPIAREPEPRIEPTPFVPAAASVEEHEPDVPPAPVAVVMPPVAPPQPAVVLPISRNPIRAEQPLPPVDDPTMSGLDRLLRVSAARGASTLYLSSESRPAVRVDGELQILEGEPLLEARDVESLLLTLMPERNHEALRTGAATEWIIDIEDVGRVRCMSFRDHRGPGGVFRLMPTRSVSVDQLGLPKVVQGMAIEPEGLVLVAGPRSSGKRTLMSAFVDLINRTRKDHVITLEREINVVHERGSSFISQREVRGNDNDLLAAARGALREDPDVLMIEELRTAALMNVALEAASSGHLVVGGFAAHSATAAVDRIIDLYAPEERLRVQLALADSLRGVIVQVLLKKRGGGRVAAREVLLNTPAVSGVIAEGKTSQLPMAIEGGRRYGMMPLNDALVGLIQQGAVDARDAYRYASDRPGLLAALKRHGVDTSFVERLA